MLQSVIYKILLNNGYMTIYLIIQELIPDGNYASNQVIESSDKYCNKRA